MVKFDDNQQKIIPLIDDTVARWITITAMIDSESVVGGDKFGNLWIVRCPRDASQEANEGGNRLTNTQDHLHFAPTCFDTVAHFFTQDIPTSVTKSNLVVGGQDAILWSGLQGTIRVLIPFVALEPQMCAQDPSPVGRNHLMYRGYCVPAKGVTDGDLCERFRLLSMETRQRIAGEFHRTVTEVEQKISVRFLVAFSMQLTTDLKCPY
ncbi:hypothetical protein FVER53590_00130 [Fusarium verticillioides]|nr:hypothetical protein FVER53590_00130 [Fusarium verticillioides]